MKKIILVLLLLYTSLSLAQIPTYVQGKKCPSSLGAQRVNTHKYTCPLPEKSLAGNIWIVAVFGDNGGGITWSLTDENADTGTLIVSNTDVNGNFWGIFRMSPTTGSHIPTIVQSSNTGGFVTVVAAEYFNLGATDVSHCNPSTAGATPTVTTSITAGSITPTVSGDLLFHYAVNTTGPQLSTNFTVGSQANITWKLFGTDTFSADGAQWGVYNSTSAINPTFTGQSLGWDSCVVAIKAASAGTAPTITPRVLYCLDAQGGSNTSKVHQFNGINANDLLVFSYNSGGQTLTITSTPSNTYSSAYIGSSTPNNSQIQYSCNASLANSMPITLSYSAASDSTTMICEVVGAATSSCLDANSGGQGGTQASQPATMTTCTNCITTITANDECFANANWSFCTATGNTAPTGANFDSAFYTDNNLDGPQTVDQNGGWQHEKVTTPSTLSTTWNISCAATNMGPWAGGVACFKPLAAGGTVRRRAWVINK